MKKYERGENNETKNGDSGVVAKTGVKRGGNWRYPLEGRRPTAYLLILAVVVFGSSFLPSATAEDYSDTQLVNAIWKAEGGEKAEYPYGIKSIKCSSLAMYRLACFQSVWNNKKRWIKADKPEDFIIFMGRRYSPPKINPNWVRLVKFFLNRKDGE